MSAGGEPRFALALGAGGARGLAHIHVVEVLDELGIRPVSIAGSSIGAIMGAGVAAGMSGRDIHSYVESVLARRAEIASRIWQSRPSSFRQAISGVRLGQFDLPRILKAFLPEHVPARFEDLGIPLKVTATDYFGRRGVVFEQGDLLTALAASAAIPGIFRAVERDDMLLIDGGYQRPVPFDLVKDDADIVIAVDVVGGPVAEDDERPRAIDLMFGTNQLMMHAITDLQLQLHRPAVFLRPNVSRFRVMDFMKVEQVLAESVAVKDELKRGIDAAMVAWQAG